MLSAEKKQDSQNRQQKHREPISFFYQYMKKDLPIYQTKVFKATKAQKNHFQVAIIITGHNPLLKIIFVENYRIDKIHKNNRKIDIAEQIVKIISIKPITQDQTQVISQVIIGVVLIQTLETYIILMIAREIHVTIEIKIIQIKETETTRNMYHSNDLSRNSCNNRNQNHSNKRNRNYSKHVSF